MVSVFPWVLFFSFFVVVVLGGFFKEIFPVFLWAFSVFRTRRPRRFPWWRLGRIHRWRRL